MKKKQIKKMLKQELKAFKKVRKQQFKASLPKLASAEQLAQLTIDQPNLNQPHVSDANSTVSNLTQAQIALQQLMQQVSLQVVDEALKPFNPIRDWLRTPANTPLSSTKSAAAKRSTSTPKFTPAPAEPKQAAIGLMPLKSPPCKKCPALSGGLCKCAAKKFGLK